MQREGLQLAAIFLFVAVSLCGQESVCDLFEDLKAADGRQLIVAGDLIISKSLAALGAAGLATWGWRRAKAVAA